MLFFAQKTRVFTPNSRFLGPKAGAEPKKYCSGSKTASAVGGFCEGKKS
jgi:hypothetical protein